MPVPRREALRRLSAGSLLALGFWPGTLRADDETPHRSFRFLVINDTHCMSPQCCSYIQEVVTQMKPANADFCLHAGDLTDKAEAPYFTAVKEIFGQLSGPMYPVIGNHDHAVHILYEEHKAYLRTFPDRINYYFCHEGWQFVGLDTTQNTKSDNTLIQADTLRWLDDTLPQLNKRQPMVIFTHFPLGMGVPLRPLNADALLERFREFNLRAVFSGHYHHLTEYIAGNVVFTTNRCCSLKSSNRGGPPQKGYFLCTAQDGHIVREFVEFKFKAKVVA